MTAASWLGVIVAFTAVQWMPYMNARVYVRGLWAAFENPDPKAAPLPAWADRAKAAHANAIENLVLFAPLALAAQVTGHGSDAPVLLAAQVYLGARVVHYVVYTAGVPVVRTLAFLTGFGATLWLAWTVATG